MQLFDIRQMINFTKPTAVESKTVTRNPQEITEIIERLKLEIAAELTELADIKARLGMAAFDADTKSLAKLQARKRELEDSIALKDSQIRDGSQRLVEAKADHAEKTISEVWNRVAQRWGGVNDKLFAAVAEIELAHQDTAELRLLQQALHDAGRGHLSVQRPLHAAIRRWKATKMDFPVHNRSFEQDQQLLEIEGLAQNAEFTFGPGFAQSAVGQVFQILRTMRFEDLQVRRS